MRVLAGWAAFAGMAFCYWLGHRHGYEDGHISGREMQSRRDYLLVKDVMNEALQKHGIKVDWKEIDPASP